MNDINERPPFQWSHASDWQRHGFLAIFTAFLVHRLSSVDETYYSAVTSAAIEARALMNTFIDAAR